MAGACFNAADMFTLNVQCAAMLRKQVLDERSGGGVGMLAWVLLPLGAWRGLGYPRGRGFMVKATACMFWGKGP